VSTEVAEKPVEQAAELTTAQRLEHEHYENIKQKATEVRAARKQWAAAKDKAKNKKGIFDELNAELIALIDGGPDMQLKLPLDGKPAKDGKPAVDDSWRKLKVDQLDIKPGLVTKLAEHGIENLGQLQDFWQSGKDLTDLADIGEAKATSVIDAFSTYGAAHPEVFGPVQNDLKQPSPAELDEASSPEAQLGTALAEEDRGDGEEKPELGVVGGDEEEEDDEEDDELVEDWDDDDDDEDEDEDEEDSEL